MRRQIAAGNWKMNITSAESAALVSEILRLLSDKPPENHLVIIFPPFTLLQQVSSLLKKGNFPVGVGGQNCHWEEKGAFTGEISSSMLCSAGAGFVLIGHSERRQYFYETNNLLARKMRVAITNGLCPVYCCGETLAERKSSRHFEVVEKQIEEGLADLSPGFFEEKLTTGTNFQNCRLIIAYEPVWAIGTGETATPEQAQEMHSFIRGLLMKNYGSEFSESVPVLYGGSCNASNAKSLFSKPDIDGGLIGGASLKTADFVSIIHSLKI